MNNIYVTSYELRRLEAALYIGTLCEPYIYNNSNNPQIHAQQMNTMLQIYYNTPQKFSMIIIVYTHSYNRSNYESNTNYFFNYI